MVDFLKRVGTGLYAAILPSTERDQVARPLGIDVAGWSLLIGLVEMPIGVLLYVMGALDFITRVGGEQVSGLLANRQPDLTRGDMIWGGILTWFAWNLHPAAWLYASVALTGFVRLVSFGISREAVCEPSVWAVLRTYQWVRRSRGAALRRRELGPERPDRALVEEGCDLVVLSSREKPAWDESATIQVGDRFYRLLGVEERPDGRWRVLAYLLKEVGPNEPLRGLVRSDAKLPTRLPGGPLESPAKRVRYFAYGPYMSEVHLRQQVPSARLVAVASYPGHLLRFYKRGRDGSGEATVVETQNPGDLVWGVVFECDEEELQRLDRAEGLEEGYRREEAEVRGTDGQDYLVQIYVAEPGHLDSKLKPKSSYRDAVVEAARENGFPRLYVGVLAAVDAHAG